MIDIDTYPDVNSREQVIEAVKNLQCWGEYSRSFSVDAKGNDVPDRYVQPLSDFYSEFAIATAVDRLINGTVYINGLDGVIIEQSRERLVVLTSEGERIEYAAIRKGEA